jgi:transposase
MHSGERVSPLIPQPERDSGRSYKRITGGGLKPISYRRVFEGIVYVLRTSCQWKALPKKRFGSTSSVHEYFTR